MAGFEDTEYRNFDESAEDHDGVVRKIVNKFESMDDQDDLEGHVGERNFAQENGSGDNGGPFQSNYNDAGLGSNNNNGDYAPFEGAEDSFATSQPMAKSEEGYTPREPEGPLLEWRRNRAQELWENQKKEEASRAALLDEAQLHMDRFWNERARSKDGKRDINKQKEEVLVAKLQAIHENASKNYWEAVLELVDFDFNKKLEESGSKGKLRGRKEEATTMVKPGKATDLSRMRSVMVKLKHKPVVSSQVAAPGDVKAAPTVTGGVMGMLGGRKK